MNRHNRHTFLPEFPPLSDEDKERILKDLDERFEELQREGIVMPIIESTPYGKPSWYRRFWSWLRGKKTPRLMTIDEITCCGQSFVKTGEIDWIKGTKYLPRKDPHAQEDNLRS